MDEEKHPFVEPRKGMSFCSKILIALAIIIPTLLLFFAIDIIVALVVTGYGSGSSTSEQSSDVCTSPSCVKLASTVLTNMDPSVDPCDDFYNYSCGGWVARNVVPSGYGSWGVFQELATQNTIFIQKLITSSVDDKVNAIKLTRRLYDSCVDLDGLEKLGAAPLIDIINKTGGWDLVNIRNGMLCSMCMWSDIP